MFWSFFFPFLLILGLGKWRNANFCMCGSFWPHNGIGRWFFGGCAKQNLRRGVMVRFEPVACFFDLVLKGV